MQKSKQYRELQCNVEGKRSSAKTSPLGVVTCYMQSTNQSAVYLSNYVKETRSSAQTALLGVVICYSNQCTNQSAVNL